MINIKVVVIINYMPFVSIIDKFINYYGTNSKDSIATMKFAWIQQCMMESNNEPLQHWFVDKEASKVDQSLLFLAKRVANARCTPWLLTKQRSSCFQVSSWRQADQ